MANLRGPEGGVRLAASRCRALADYDPDNAKWATLSDMVVVHLIQHDAMQMGQWLEALRPVRRVLLPTLLTIFRDPKSMLQNAAAESIARLNRDDPRFVVDLVTEATPRQFQLLFPVLEANARDVLPRLQTMLGDPHTGAQGSGHRGGRAVATRARGSVWPLLAHRSDPEVRSELVHLLAACGADASMLIRRFEDEPDVSVRRALLLSVGEFPATNMLACDRQDLKTLAVALYQEGPDPGEHAAAMWLLRQWKQDAEIREVNRLLARRWPTPPTSEQGWFVTSQGQTMVVLPGPAEFDAGSPETEPGRAPDQRIHHVRLAHRFALADREVNVEQYLRFQPGASKAAADTPIMPNWVDAVRYCRWLSEQEGVPENEMCYPPLAEINEKMKTRPDFLARTGYRLSTEAEWEFACRAGATTSRYFGDSDALLRHYAWYSRNSEWRFIPGARLKPNDFGLFDMLGNVWEWCQDDTGEGKARVFRGGSMASLPWQVRSAEREWAGATERTAEVIGFRPARTIRPRAEVAPCRFSAIVPGSRVF